MGHAHSIRENPGQIMGIAAMSAAIGAIAAMLFTPRSGQEMRGTIMQKAMDRKEAMRNKMQSNKDDMVDKVDDVTEAAKTKTAQAADKTKDKTER